MERRTLLDNDALLKGMLPGIIAGYFFLAFVGGRPVPVGLEEGSTTIVVSTGFVESVGKMVGAGALSGFFVHIIISMIIGALYTGAFLNYVELGNAFMNVVAGGLIYGLIWWLIGTNIIMPALTGDPVLQLTLGPIFYGHIIFGHMLAFLVIRNREWEYVSVRSYAKRSRREHPAGYVYGIFNSKTQLTKIGRTIDPKQRLRQLRQEHGRQLEYKKLMKSKNAPKDESRLHKKYESRRIDGEWFDLD